MSFTEPTPNPLSSLSVPPTLLADLATVRNRAKSDSAAPYALIATKAHPTLPLSIHNYIDRAFWSSSPFLSYTSSDLQSIIDSPKLQNESLALALTVACRSLVTHTTTGSVVARSFSKFFNYHEKLAYIPSGAEFSYEIEEKLDGSIITFFWFDAKDHDPTNLLGPGRGGQWIIASKSSFDSPHTKSAWNVLNKLYPFVLQRGTILDKTKAYIFELIDPKLPIKVKYTGPPDLVLLTIIGRDSSEPKADSNIWTTLPFRRPRRWSMRDLVRDAAVLNPKQLTKLYRENEEGFVIKFWRTKADNHPRRIKVKLEAYLKSLSPQKDEPPIKASAESKEVKKVVESLAKISINKASTGKSTPITIKPHIQIASAPSPSIILSIYKQHRLRIPSFVDVDVQMLTIKEPLLQVVQNLGVLDDYGGEPWLDKISRTFDRIHAIFSLNEESWTETILLLECEGYRPQPSASAATTAGNKTKTKASSKTNPDLAKRTRKSDVDKAFRPAIEAWFSAQEVSAIVRLVVESTDVPADLRSPESIIL